MITGIIVVTNIVVRSMTKILVEKIGYHSRSFEGFKICKIIFFAQLLNVGFLRLLSNANFKNIGGKYIFNGNFSDFDKNWYFEVGPRIMTTMLIESIIPYA